MPKRLSFNATFKSIYTIITIYITYFAQGNVKYDYPIIWFLNIFKICSPLTNTNTRKLFQLIHSQISPKKDRLHHVIITFRAEFGCCMKAAVWRWFSQYILQCADRKVN